MAVEGSTGATPSQTPEAAALVGDGLGVKASDKEESSTEDLQKWKEMMSVRGGIGEFWRQYPDRFLRRQRRGIPQEFRWDVWKVALKLDNADWPTNYDKLAKDPNTWTHLIEIDIARTFPKNKAFGDEQQERLMRILNAYAAYRPEIGYCQGMNFVAGLLLLVSEGKEYESFGVLLCLMDNVGLQGFYRDRLPLLRRYLKACDGLVKESVPDLRDHFKKENVHAAAYLHEWFLTLFINCFPMTMVHIIWDAIICEGLPVVLKIAVSILQVLKDSLLSMQFEDIVRFFKMMRVENESDGELNAYRIGQLLMKHTEHVVIPPEVFDYITKEEPDDEPGPESGGEEEETGGSPIWQNVVRILSVFGGSGTPSDGPRWARTSGDASTADPPADDSEAAAPRPAGQARASEPEPGWQFL